MQYFTEQGFPVCDVTKECLINADKAISFIN